MSTDVSSVASHFPSAENGFTTTTSGAVSSGASTVGLNSVAGYSNGEIAAFVIDPTDTIKKQVFTGTIDTAGVQVTNVVWTAGTNQGHDAGATVVDYATATHISMMSKGILVQHKQSGAHANTITTDTINENTAANGVTVDGVNIKDSKLNTDGSVVPSNLVTGTGSTWAWSAYSPTVTAGSGTFTSVSATGRYIQQGKTVTALITVTITTNGTAASSVIVTLPVTAQASSGMGGYGRADAVSGKMVQGKIASTTTVAIFNYDGTYPGASSEVIRFTAVYEAA